MMTDPAKFPLLGRRRLLLTGGALLAGTPARAARHHKHAAAAAAEPAATAKPAAAPGDEDADTGGDATSSASAANTPVGPLDTVAREGCIIDFNTGATLLDKQADAPMVPSSLTKLMTAYLVFQALAAGKLTLTQQLPVSEKAWRMGGSKMFVPYPGSVAVEDLIRGMITQSGNDACIVLAEGISGSEDQFVNRMNEAAAKLELKNSNFRNCTGWPDPDHHMSPRDIAELARHLIADFPQYYHYFGEKDYSYNGIHQGNRNTLVAKGIADGLKTGHTQEGGFGECTSAERNGRRVIVVLNGMSSMHERAHETERLLEWAFASFENVQFMTQGQTFDTIPVWMGTEPGVTLVGGQTALVTLPRGWKTKAKVEVTYATPVRAPVRQGDQLGHFVIAGDGIPAMDLPLVASSSVPRIGLTARAMRVVSHFVTGA
jgi:D-alanyl-D-alanine carboxypeptidase (penicillin-binding protein 5/6)